MSFKSWGSKGRVDLEVLAMLDDLEDLDYEPDGGDEQEEDSRDQVPEPSGQELELSSNHTSSERQSPSYGAELEDPSSNIQSFRSERQSLSNGKDLDSPSSNIPSFREKMNYIDLHVDVEKDSVRSKFTSYYKGSESRHLDSSDEDVEPDFSEVEYEQNDFVSESNFGCENEESCAGNFEPPVNPDYIGPDSPLGSDSQLYYDEDSASDSGTYPNMTASQDLIDSPISGAFTFKASTEEVLSDSNIAVKGGNQEFNRNNQIPPPKKKSLNFTVQVIGQKRFCVSVPIKKKQKPWLTSIEEYFSNIISLSSMDEVIKFCPGVERLNTSSMVSSERPGSAQDSIFKMPLRRPPTRQKSSIKSLSVSVDQRGTMTVKDTEDRSDIISLIASTTIEEDQEDYQEHFSIPVKSERASLSSSAVVEKVKMNRVAEWVENTNMLKIPPIYKGLCYLYFFDDKCTNQLCRNSHLLETHLTRISGLQHLSDIELTEAYEFAKANSIFFQRIYSTFAKVFAIKDNKAELVNMVSLIFDGGCRIDKVEGLKTILDSLQNTNLGTFEDTVEYLLLKVGLGSFTELGETLVEIIISMGNLPSRWPILRRLFIAGETISLKLASKFLVNLMRDPIDHKVCQDVYRHILKYKCLDLPSIFLGIREPFLKLCTLGYNERCQEKELEARIDRNLSAERDNFERGNGTDVNSIDRDSGSSTTVSRIPNDFSVPPPNFSAFGRVHTSRFRSQLPVENIVARPAPFLNFIPPGGGSDSQQSFASLARQDQFITSASLNAPNEGLFSNKNVPNYSFTGPPHTSNRNIRCNSYNSSEDDGSAARDNLGDSDSTNDQNPLYFNPPPTIRPTNMDYSVRRTYNREGLQYDPANDYVPPIKTRHIDTTQFNPAESNRSTDMLSEFDRLKQSNSSPEQRTNKRVAVMSPRNKQPPQRRQKPNHGLAAEPLVSSSSDPQSRNEKPPEHPIFGFVYFDPNYSFNVSLHNLYLQKIDNVDINEDDVHRLNDCVKNGNGKGFLDLVAKYSGPLTVQNFISMTLAHLKGMNQMVARTYRKLLLSIEEHNPYFYGSLKVRVVLEVITMNLLFELEKRNMFEDATFLLKKFSNWDSLITSRLFITDTRIGVSIVGRYLFIAKMLVNSKPELSYEILACANLHLLEEYQKWPYHLPFPIPEISSADLEARNIVLLSILKNGFILNTAVVTQLYKIALRRKGGIWSFEVRPFINPMVVELLNRNQIVSLKQIHSEINLFFNYMEKDTLRAFLIVMYEHLSKTDIFRLFEKCVARNIYQKFVSGQVLDQVVEIKTNMLPQEIEIIILYFFHKLAELQYLPPGYDSVKFEIKPPGEFRIKSLGILNTNNSLANVKEYIKNMLKTKCMVNGQTFMSNIVEVDRIELQQYLENPGF